MSFLDNPVQLILGLLLVLSSVGVILLRNPVHACLSFLLTLFCLADIYLQLSAQFNAVMQLLVYAGAILVIFMFVIVLFQDAYQHISDVPPKSTSWFLFAAATAFTLVFVFLGRKLVDLSPSKPVSQLPDGYGNVNAIGKALYLDFFFPFEVVILLFLVAVVGALYIGKKVR